MTACRKASILTVCSSLGSASPPASTVRLGSSLIDLYPPHLHRRKAKQAERDPKRLPPIAVELAMLEVGSHLLALGALSHLGEHLPRLIADPHGAAVVAALGAVASDRGLAVAVAVGGGNQVHKVRVTGDLELTVCPTAYCAFQILQVRVHVSLVSMPLELLHRRLRPH